MNTAKIQIWADKGAKAFLCGGIACLSIVFIYVVIRIAGVKQAEVRNLQKSDVYWLYALMSLGGMGWCGFILTLKKTSRINFTLTTFSCFLGMYIMELFLTIVDNGHVDYRDLFQQRRQLAHAANIPFDDRTVSQILFELQQTGIDAYPAIFPSHFLGNTTIQAASNASVFPLSGIAQKTTVFCNESGQSVVYDSDEYGFNNPCGVFGQKDIDIALLGDSFTQGYCVAPEENIGGLLRQEGKRVINLGMNGNGPLLELAILKEFVAPVQPEIVVWLYYEGNDMRDLQRERANPFLINYLKPDFSQGLIQKQAEVNQFLIAYIHSHNQNSIEREHSQHRDALNVMLFLKLWNLRHKLQFAPVPVEPMPVELFATILRQARELVSSWGGKLYFVYLPDWARYAKRVSNNNLLLSKTCVISLVQETAIPIIDGDEAFLRHADPLSLFPFKLSGHYTKEGYQVITQAIRDSIEM